MKSRRALILLTYYYCLFLCGIYQNHIGYVTAKRFETRCKLVRELLRVGLKNDIFLGHWVCLIEKVSNRETTKLTTSGSKKLFGIYQIPSGRWCKEGRRGGECSMACESLLDDDIQDDTDCATKIFTMEGFKFWTQWTRSCKDNKRLINEIVQEIYSCPELNDNRWATRSRLVRSISEILLE